MDIPHDSAPPPKRPPVGAARGYDARNMKPVAPPSAQPSSAGPPDLRMNLRLSVFWFLYMGGLGIFFPYYSLYLRRDLGLAEGRVGLVMAMIPLVGLAVQPLWGSFADRTGSRRGTLAILALGVAGAYFVVPRASTFAGAVGVTVLLAVFLTAVLPMATAVTLAAQSRKGGSAFGYVRMWGTLGFLVSVIVFPHALDLLQSEGWRIFGPATLEALRWDDLAWLFPLAALLSLLAVGAALILPPSPDMTLRSSPGDMARLLRHPPVRRLLFVVLLAHLCLQGPINFFPLLIAEKGGDVGSISGMWVFMLLLEIPLIGFSGPTLRRFGARTLLVVGLLAEGIRWTTCAFVDDLSVVRVVQLLHGVGVAGVIIGGPLYLEQSVPRRLRSTGQTLVSTMGFGLGAIVSVTALGWLFERFGAALPYGVAGAGALVLAALVYRLLPEPHRPDEE